MRIQIPIVPAVKFQSIYFLDVEAVADAEKVVVVVVATVDAVAVDVVIQKQSQFKSEPAFLLISNC